MTTEPEMRAAAVAAVQAMESPQPVAAPVAAEPTTEAQAEPVTEQEHIPVEGDGSDVVEGDNPDSQGQDVDGTEGQAEGEEGTDQAAEAVEAPEFWPSEAKSAFAKLDAEGQEALRGYYKTAQTQINAKFEEAAEVRKTANARIEAFDQISARITEAATVAEERFKGYWDGMTESAWLKLARDNPDEYTFQRAQYDAEQNALQQANAAKEAAARVERQNWLATQAEELKTLAPDLIDKEHGKARWEKTTSYLKERGAKEQDLTDVSAAVMALAYDAMRYRDLMANRPKPNPKPVPKPGLSPAAGVAAVPTEKRQVDALKNRFNQTKDRGDAVAMLQAQGLI